MGKSSRSGTRYCTQLGCKKTVKSKPCAHCGVYYKCRDHCDCKGTENAKGRKAPRPAKADRTRPEVAQQASVQAPVIPPAAGRPPTLGVKVFTDIPWLGHALQEIRGAKHVVLASYVYNNHQVQELLKQKLQGRSEFECIIAVDKSAYGKSVAPGEKTKLKELKDLGAAVHLCDGQKGSGIFHWKCIIVDGKVVFTGSANVTQGCLNNWELVIRMVGPPVTPIRDGLRKALEGSARL